MLVKKITMGILFAAVAVCFAQRPGSTTSITLESGAEVILHPDSTWAYARPGIIQTDDKDDVFITLKDNRILWLKSDYTYTFTKTMPKGKENRKRDYVSVTAMGTATNRDLNTAFQMAQNDAYNKTAGLMKRYVPVNAKNGQAYLMACLKDDFKENEIDLTQTQVQTNWKVEAKIALPVHRVQKIIECLDLQLEQQ